MIIYHKSETLSDGSLAWDVVISDDENRIQLSCIDQGHAESLVTDLFDAFRRHTVDWVEDR